MEDAEGERTGYETEEKMKMMGYSMYVFHGNRLLRPYKDREGYYHEEDYENRRYISDINTIRKMACKVLPRNSSLTYVAVYINGTTSGYVAHFNDLFLFMPVYPGSNGREFKSVTYILNPDTGRIVGKTDRVYEIDYRSHNVVKTRQTVYSRRK